MSKIARLSAVSAAISALTLDDLESFNDQDVLSFRRLGRASKSQASDLEYDLKRAEEIKAEEASAEEDRKTRAELRAKIADITPEQEQEMRDRLQYGAPVDRIEFYNALPLVKNLSPLERECCLRGKKINAIKLVRERTNMGLAYAKNTVEAANIVPRATESSFA